ncbi:MAG: S8 family serine peptidase [Chloroflexota bacterium]|nr:S8 family serine peptidase [Chloroflexota bacterium]
MTKRIFSAVAAALSAAGAIFWWNRRLDSQERIESPMREEMPASATSLSAQPHKRTRLVPPTPTKKLHVPPPDSAGEGRTPYYFVPGEALVTLRSAELPPLDFLPTVAERFGASYLPVGKSRVSYPVPEGEDWFTVVRLKWATGADYEETLERFTTLEAQVNEGVAWDDVRVAGWMPNWLGTVAGVESNAQWYTPGGPGSYPRPLPAPADGLALVDAPFLGELREAMSEPVTLAVLDAFPSPEALKNYTAPKALEPLLERLSTDTRDLSLDSSQHYATFPTGEPFDMSDHGLMTTWLATEVIGVEGLEHVTLEPIRVATAEGVCSAADVIAGLARLVQRAREGENIVVLLASVIGMMDIVPPRLRLYEEHYEALRLACLSLSEAGAVLLGAAGNDASGLQHPPRTRRPAAFRSVIEVTAGQLAQSDLALYANQAKALCLFGGEANLLYEISDTMPYLIGPAVSSELRVSNDRVEANEQGWVAWAGTSFAAALAAGLAVMLRSDQPDLKMWDVRTQLRKLATSTRNPGNVPFIDLVRP